MAETIIKNKLPQKLCILCKNFGTIANQVRNYGTMYAKRYLCRVCATVLKIEG